MLADKCFYNVSAVVTLEQLPTVTVYTDRWWKSIMSPSHRVSRPFPKIIQKTILVIRKRTKKKVCEREKSDVFLWVNSDMYKFQRFGPTIINDDPHNII